MRPIIYGRVCEICGSNWKITPFKYFSGRLKGRTRLLCPECRGNEKEGGAVRGKEIPGVMRREISRLTRVNGALRRAR